MEYIIEMIDITKEFPGIRANDHITLCLKKGEVHALLGENGAGKSTLMSVLFGLYQPEHGTIKVKGQPVKINGPMAANALGIGMVHQHFKLVHNFTVLQNIILGVESVSSGLLKMEEAKKRVIELSNNYHLHVDPDAYISDISVGMQQRVEILKMLYRNNEILIFDEPTAVLTPQEIDELMGIMKELVKEGKSILFITHKLNEIKAVANRCTVLRRGKCIGTVEVETTDKDSMSEMMVGRKVNFKVDKTEAKPKQTILQVSSLTILQKTRGNRKPIVHGVNLEVRKGEIVSIAGVDGNGQSEFIQAITGLMKADQGVIRLKDEDITKKNIRYRNTHSLSHIPEDRHKHGLILEYSLEENLVLQEYFKETYQRGGFQKSSKIRENALKLIEAYDIRSGQGPNTRTASMSGGNQQKAIIAREIQRSPDLLIAVQPTRGLDVGAIEFVHKQLIKERDRGSAVLLVSFELEEVMNLSDRILVMYEGEIVANLKPNEVTIQELGLYMAGSKRGKV